MKNNEIIDRIIDNLIMIDCPFLVETTFNTHVDFIYKNHLIKINSGSSVLIWINGECYTISNESHKKLMNYVKFKRSLNDLHMDLIKDVRRVKLRGLEVVSNQLEL